MKNEIASLELHYLIRELQPLIGARVGKIFQPVRNELLFQMHVTSQGKRLLRIKVPESVFLTDFKEEQHEAPGGFCMLLRKYLSNTHLSNIVQRESERILELVFQSRDNEYHLFVELFSKGNIILCDAESKIIFPLSTQKWRDREVKRGGLYTYPKKGYNLFKITKDELASLLKESKKDSVVKMLAVDLGLGGIYAEEACLISGVDKHKKSLAATEIDQLHKAVQSLSTRKLLPGIIYQNGQPICAVPFALNIYADCEFKKYKTFSSALQNIFSHPKPSRHENRIKELKRIIEEQTARACEIVCLIEENTAKGEAIYSKYLLIQEILTELKKAREKYSWLEIKEKELKHIKNVNERENKVTVHI